MLPTRGKPMGGRLPADLPLDGIEFADLAQRLGGNRRSGSLRNVIELAPGVRPARGENDIAFARQLFDRTCTSSVRAGGNSSPGRDRSDATPQREPATRTDAPCS